MCNEEYTNHSSPNREIKETTRDKLLITFIYTYVHACVHFIVHVLPRSCMYTWKRECTQHTIFTQFVPDHIQVKNMLEKISHVFCNRLSVLFVLTLDDTHSTSEKSTTK